jgi:hypothetical protein
LDKSMLCYPAQELISISSIPPAEPPHELSRTLPQSPNQPHTLFSLSAFFSHPFRAPHTSRPKHIFILRQLVLQLQQQKLQCAPYRPRKLAVGPHVPFGQVTGPCVHDDVCTEQPRRVQSLDDDGPDVLGTRVIFPFNSLGLVCG